jgi:Beta-galactosidase/beta-glucuronidase
MRKVISLNKDWTFHKQGVSEQVWIPHTWNALDGQDGGDDYYRGCCRYEKTLDGIRLEEGEQVWLEFLGVNSIAEVFVNGHLVGRHEGGYSTFRCDITAVIQEYNTIIVDVDNAPNDHVYPQKADFTFYGGIYRDVNLVIVPRVHFEMDLYGSPGAKITPALREGRADIAVEAWLSGTKESMKGLALEVAIQGADGTVASGRKELCEDCCQEGSGHPEWGVRAADTCMQLVIDQPHLWQGIKDPYLYTARICLVRGEELWDEVSLRFGCRSFYVDPRKGFFLNGEPYPLRGVSRHQDRENVGCALTPAMHREDMELIAESGADSIRLAHYQHDPYFYDLCDEYGMVVWAEIPYITMHMNQGRENTVSQMRELILQNHHHASICFWGLSNEVTVGGVTDSMLENNRALQRLSKALDSTRLTTMACAFMLDENSPMLAIPDVVAYNHYFGWYSGELEDNDAWFDAFHASHEKLPVGLSEYGAEAVLRWQTGRPERGDYTEQYQAKYHEHMLEMIEARPYIWCCYVWNMFDFAADGRDEGGVKGRNNKGLVTFDRKEKKDAFYLYKAYWCRKPFVHIAGKRYRNRAEDVTEITVYSNQEQVELYCDGSFAERQEGQHVFRFRIRLGAETTVVVKCGENVQDTAVFCRVEKTDPSYTLPTLGTVSNWFDDIADLKDGYFSLEDKVGDLVQNPHGMQIFRDFMAVYDSRKKGAAAASHMTEEQRLRTMRSMRIKELIRRTNTPQEEAMDWLWKLQQVKKDMGNEQQQ